MASKNRSLLVIGHVWPEPEVSAAGSRMMQLLESFKEAGYTLHFGTPAETSTRKEELQKRGIQILALPLNNALASRTIRELQPDVVIFDRFMTEEQFGWRVQDEAPKALRLLNTEDLHSLRTARELALKAGGICDPAFWLQQDITLRELSSILRCDLSLMISRPECDWLKESGIIATDIIFYLPFILDAVKDYRTDIYNSFDTRSNFCFIGYGRHAPNADAVRFMLGSIWPLIRRELPQAQLQVFGKDYPADIQAMHDPQKGICVKGWVRDSDTALSQTRVNLAPLRFGAGLKGKIVHALQQGTPTVTTSGGAEGLLPAKKFNHLIADEPEAFAAKAVNLYVDEALWQDAVDTMYAHLSGELNRNIHHERLHQRLDSLLEALQDHRSTHVLGRVLRYQSHQSTRYMAKWIEAKKRS